MKAECTLEEYEVHDESTIFVLTRVKG
jgi:hypothetical protein